MKFRRARVERAAAELTRHRSHVRPPWLTPRLASLIVAACGCLLMICWSRTLNRPETRPRPGPRDDHPSEIVDATDLDTGARPGTPHPPSQDSVSGSDLQAVQDDTMFRAAESDAWFHIIHDVSRTTFAKLASQSTGVVGYRQLFDQPDTYRGQVVSLQGTMERAHWVPATESEFGVQGYGQYWLRPDGSTEPVVVYTPRLEPDFLDRQDHPYPVQVVGVFFKRWAYRSLGGLRTAPLVVGLIRPGSQDEHSATATEAPGQTPMAAKPRTPALTEFWSLLEIDDHGWNEFQDGSELSAEESGAAEYLLECLRRIPVSSWERDQAFDVDWDNLVREPAVWRGRVMHIVGRLQHVEPLNPAGTGYRCQIGFAQGAASIELWTNEVPEALRPPASPPGSSVLDERVSAAGMFLKMEPGADGPALLFVAPRLAWHPDRIDPDRQISSDLVALAGRGFDVGLLDDVGLATSLDRGEREAFYQLLSVVGHSVDREAAEPSRPDVPVSRLVQATPADRGLQCTLVGTARSAVRVAVDDADIEERFGLHAYYEVVVFVEPDVRIQIVDAAGATKEFATYPVVYCCRELPADCPTGEAIQVPMRISGVFLTNWQYRSEFLSRGWQAREGHAIQSSPLILGFRPQLLPTPMMRIPQFDIWFTGMFFGGLLALACLAIWFRHEDRRRPIRRRSEDSLQFPHE